VFFNYLLPNSTVDTETLEPLEPLVFVNQSDLGMLSGLEGEENIFVTPAIVLKYADEKAWNQTASDVTMAAIDAASLATGYAEIKAGVSGLRRAWTLMDMTNSGINLTLNASLASQNARVKQLLEAYKKAVEEKIDSGYHRRSKSENAFLRWKTIPGAEMYARKMDNQPTQAAIKVAVLNRFIPIATPKAEKVA
jgi:hypothetical protein